MILLLILLLTAGILTVISVAVISVNGLIGRTPDLIWKYGSPEKHWLERMGQQRRMGRYDWKRSADGST